MRRFIIPHDAIEGDSATISGDHFHHMVRVLRMKAGDRLLLSDGRGRDYIGRILMVEEERAVIDLKEREYEQRSLTPLRITLYQGMPKGDKLDLVIQKCTELGVSEFVTFTAARSVARPPEKRLRERVERWRRIALEASRQCNRPTVPTVEFAADISAICGSSDHDVKILLWEGEKGVSLKQALAGIAPAKRVAVMVGPEGGLENREAEAAQAAGFISVSLGERILRTETAGLVVVSILQFLWGDLG